MFSNSLCSVTHDQAAPHLKITRCGYKSCGAARSDAGHNDMGAEIPVTVVASRDFNVGRD